MVGGRCHSALLSLHNSNPTTVNIILDNLAEFPLTPMRVLAPRSMHARLSAWAPMDMSGKFLVHMSAESPPPQKTKQNLKMTPRYQGFIFRGGDGEDAALQRSVPPPCWTCPPPPVTESPPFQRISRCALGLAVPIATNRAKSLLYKLSRNPLD